MPVPLAQWATMRIGDRYPVDRRPLQSFEATDGHFAEFVA